jgi:hypothetical protein
MQITGTGTATSTATSTAHKLQRLRGTTSVLLSASTSSLVKLGVSKLGILEDAGIRRTEQIPSVSRNDAADLPRRELRIHGEHLTGCQRISSL